MYSNLNIQKTPNNASPMSRSNSSSQYVFNSFSDNLKAPKHPISWMNPVIEDKWDINDWPVH